MTAYKAILAVSLAYVLSISMVKSQTCFVTKTGTRYHLPECSSLKFSRTPYDYQEALENGYIACKKCKPTREKLIENSAKIDQLGPIHPPIQKRMAKSVQCKGKTKEGKRCKIDTKNASGYCYHHG